MACPKCGVKARRVEGKKIICECGFIEDVKFPNIIDLRRRTKKPRKPYPEALE